MSEQNIPTPIDATLTNVGEAADAKVAGDAIRELQALIGDTPASEQISAAITNHEHKNYASLDEFNKLKDIVMQLCDLVGDTAVSEQISMSFNALNEALLTKL
jgi:hypothetical protein